MLGFIYIAELFILSLTAFLQKNSDMSFDDPFKEGDVVGIHDEAVSKSTAFRVNLSHQLLFVNGDETGFIYIIPGCRYCGFANLYPENSDYIEDGNYFEHEKVFDRFKCDKRGPNNFLVKQEEFSYRVVSTGIKIMNVGSDSSMAGSFEICDYLINTDYKNYSLHGTFANEEGVAFNEFENLDCKFRHFSTYMNNLSKMDMTDQLNYISGSIHEIHDAPLMLKSLNLVHNFKHISSDYVCDFAHFISELKCQNVYVSENRLLVHDLIDNQFFGKLIRLKAGAGNRIKIQLVINYEVLSTIPELIKHAMPTPMAIGEGGLPPAPGDGQRGVPGNDGNFVTPIRGQGGEGGVSPPGDLDSGKRIGRDVFGVRRRPIPESNEENLRRRPIPLNELEQRRKPLPVFDEDVPELVDEGFDIKPPSMVIMDRGDEMFLSGRDNDDPDLIDELVESKIIKDLEKVDPLGNKNQIIDEALVVAEDAAEETGLIEKYEYPIREHLAAIGDYYNSFTPSWRDFFREGSIKKGMIAATSKAVIKRQNAPVQYKKHMQNAKAHMEKVGAKRSIPSIPEIVGALDDINNAYADEQKIQELERGVFADAEEAGVTEEVFNKYNKLKPDPVDGINEDGELHDFYKNDIIGEHIINDDGIVLIPNNLDDDQSVVSVTETPIRRKKKKIVFQDVSGETVVIDDDNIKDNKVIIEKKEKKKEPVSSVLEMVNNDRSLRIRKKKVIKKDNEDEDRQRYNKKLKMS